MSYFSPFLAQAGGMNPQMLQMLMQQQQGAGAQNASPQIPALPNAPRGGSIGMSSGGIPMGQQSQAGASPLTGVLGTAAGIGALGKMFGGGAAPAAASPYSLPSAASVAGGYTSGGGYLPAAANASGLDSAAAPNALSTAFPGVATGADGMAITPGASSIADVNMGAALPNSVLSQGSPAVLSGADTAGSGGFFSWLAGLGGSGGALGESAFPFMTGVGGDAALGAAAAGGGEAAAAAGGGEALADAAPLLLLA